MPKCCLYIQYKWTYTHFIYSTHLSWSSTFIALCSLFLSHDPETLHLDQLFYNACVFRAMTVFFLLSGVTRRQNSSQSWQVAMMRPNWLGSDFSFITQYCILWMDVWSGLLCCKCMYNVHNMIWSALPCKEESYIYSVMGQQGRLTRAKAAKKCKNFQKKYQIICINSSKCLVLF